MAAIGCFDKFSKRPTLIDIHPTPNSLGAATTANGILVVQVANGPSASAPGAFALAAPLVHNGVPYELLRDSGDGNYVGFLTNNDAKIPMEPATYVLPAGNSALGGSNGGPIGTMITLEGTETNWMLSADGELVITEFDNTHIAGHFTLPITDALATMNGASKGDAVMTGSFNFANPN